MTSPSPSMPQSGTTGADLALADLALTDLTADLSIAGEVLLLIDLLKLGTFIGGPMREDVASPLNITTTDLRIVLALGGEGELAGHELSEIMGVGPMNVSRAVTGLINRGLVEPGLDQANRRRKPVRLTAQGQALFARILQAMAKVSANLFKGVSVRDREAFRRTAATVLSRIGRITI